LPSIVTLYCDIYTFVLSNATATTDIYTLSLHDALPISENLNPLQRGIKTLADIFIPILPAIVTAGLLMGINNIMTAPGIFFDERSEEHTSELQSRENLVCRLLLEKKNRHKYNTNTNKYK